MSGELVGKRLAPLRDLLTKAPYFGVLTNLKIAPFNGATSVIECLMKVLTANTSGEIDSACLSLLQYSTSLAFMGIERRHLLAAYSPIHHDGSTIVIRMSQASPTMWRSSHCEGDSAHQAELKGTSK